MQNTSHTMRLRSRENGATNNDGKKNRLRSSLSDISNRLSRHSSKTSKGKSQSIVYNDQSQNVQKPRRVSDRLRRIREKETVKIENNAASKSSAKDSNQTKKRSRSSVHDNTKQSNDSKTGTKRRRASLRSSSSSKTNENPKLLAPIVMDDHIREDEDKYQVHPDFRLQRATYNGKNHTLGMAKYDRENKDDVLLAAPYVADMFQYQFTKEGKSRPRTYMYEQTDINSKMRAILVDWLVEVHMKFRLVPETLYLCINIIDRYCSQVKVKRAKLQLVGVTALLLACKYEEIYPPEVRDCVYITDSAYDRDEVLNMEQDIVHKLGFRITVPTAYPFLQRFLNIVKASSLIKHAASYYTERTLQEHDLLRFRPSLICAAAVVLAINNKDIDDEHKIEEQVAGDNNEWPCVPPILIEYTGFSRFQIIDCAELVSKKVAEETVTASRRQLLAVKRKYDNKKYLNVSTQLRLPCITSRDDTDDE
mmetsp:Transcript_6726/g.7297  ORF Transcript_6726/g.7297 Transcript_6726/m.7297 type:complete len:478 (+) Transcript_6726:159-1592(+)